MSWFLGGPPQPGDWIKLTDKVPVSFTDTLSGGGVPAGTRGVVTDVSGFFGGHLVARLDGGLFGSMTVRVRARQVRVIRRGGGIEAYEQNASRRGAVRIGAATALLAPLLYFAVTYMATGGTTDGLIAALVGGALYSVLDMIEYLLANPVQGLLYCLVVWGVGRLAFGRW